MIRWARLGVVAAALLVSGSGCRQVTQSATRVVLVTLDTTRADRLGCYGYADAETPAVDGLASEGVLFERALSPVPTTLPAHSTMFTGLYPQDHQVRYNLLYKLSDKATTLAEVLGEAGWATAAFPASAIVAERFGLKQGFQFWAEPPMRDEEETDFYEPLSNIRPASEGVDAALAWLDTTRGQRQFVWLHFYDAHWPYTPPFPYSSTHRDRPYDGEISYTDNQLGRLLEALRRSSDWDDTVVIVVADHGEGLYDHAERFHSLLLYETTQHIPLIIRAPGAQAGGRVAAPATLADLMPTILDLAGVASDLPFRGISLWPALAGDELPLRDLYVETLAGAVAYGWQELYGLRAGRFKLIDSTEPQLFDLLDDPSELNNLAPNDPTRLEELRNVLEEMKQAIGEVGDLEDALVDLDPETEAVLTSMGYTPGSISRTAGTDAPLPQSLIDLEPEILHASTLVANNRWDEVVDVCEYALSRDPKNKWALNTVVRALSRLGRQAEALPYADRLELALPDAERTYETVAQLHHELGDEDKAFAFIVKGLERIPNSAKLRYLLLVTGFDAGRSEVCTEMVPSATADHPESWRILLMQARCEARQSKPESALATLRHAFDLGMRRADAILQAEDFSAVVELPDFQVFLEELEARRNAQSSEASSS